MKRQSTATSSKTFGLPTGFGLRRQSAAKTALSDRRKVFSTTVALAPKSGVALRSPPRSRTLVREMGARYQFEGAEENVRA